jgi:hypothetical protein
MSDHYERKDINARAVAASGIILATGIFGIQLLLRSGFIYLHHRQVAESNEGPIPADFLRSNSPEQELAKYHQEVDQVLNHYGWVNREKGIVRIPIEEAMKRISHEE